MYNFDVFWNLITTGNVFGKCVVLSDYLIMNNNSYDGLTYNEKLGCYVLVN